VFLRRIDEVARARRATPRMPTKRRSDHRRVPRRFSGIDGRRPQHRRALGALFTFIRDANSAVDAGRISAATPPAMKAALAKIDPVLDIFPNATSRSTPRSRN